MYISIDTYIYREREREEAVPFRYTPKGALRRASWEAVALTDLITGTLRGVGGRGGGDYISINRPDSVLIVGIKDTPLRVPMTSRRVSTKAAQGEKRCSYFWGPNNLGSLRQV